MREKNRQRVRENRQTESERDTDDQRVRERQTDRERHADEQRVRETQMDKETHADRV